MFNNSITDTVVQLPFTIDQQGIFINSEDSRSYGLDTALRFDSVGMTKAPVNVFVTGVYTLSRAIFTGALLEGRQVPQVPIHAGSLSAGVGHVRGWHASVTVESSGRFFSDSSNIVPLTLVDEMASSSAPAIGSTCASRSCWAACPAERCSRLA